MQDGSAEAVPSDHGLGGVGIAEGGIAHATVPRAAQREVAELAVLDA